MGSEIQHDPSLGSFSLKAGNSQALLDYERHAGRMIITHTYVPPELRGQGLAGQLVSEALGYARKENLKVIPQCSYVDAYMRRHGKFEDLRA